MVGDEGKAAGVAGGEGTETEGDMGEMKPSEIVVGGIYTNGKGQKRKIIAEGDYAYAACASDHDCVMYVLITKHIASFRYPKSFTTTRAAFARWAKERIG